MSADPELIDLINELTQPIRVDVWQGMTKHVRTDPPLLDQLKAAVTSNVGGAGGGSKAARERTPLDVIAFTLLEQIDGQVRAWLKDAGEPWAGDISPLLRAWYVMHTRYERPKSDRHFGIVARWVASIHDLIDPPTRQEITSPCPNCGQTWVTRGQGNDAESLRALWALWRGNAEDSAAHCEGCGKTWKGVSQMRSLRIAIDDAEKLSEPA